tara:strand:+ start:354 stop:905 length:552 start_codon:yes stop_codon:yes gene_type:complete
VTHWSLRVVRIVSAAAGLVLLSFVLLLATRDGGNGPQSKSPLIGELVPHVEGVRFDGESFDVDEVTSGWVLINFFASWCVPCVREHPELVEWNRRHRLDGVVISVPFGDTEKDARAFFVEHGGNWPVLIDNESAWAVAFGVLRPPESFLVAPGGVVVAKWQGQITADEVDRVVVDLQERNATS